MLRRCLCPPLEHLRQELMLQRKETVSCTLSLGICKAIARRQETFLILAQWWVSPPPPPPPTHSTMKQEKERKTAESGLSSHMGCISCAASWWRLTEAYIDQLLGKYCSGNTELMERLMKKLKEAIKHA